MMQQVLAGHRRIRVLNHGDQDIFLAELAWNADGRCFEHGRVVHDLRFDFEGGDVLASAPDRILDPVDKKIVSIVVPAKTITGVKPAVAPCRCGRFRIRKISVRHGPWTIGPQYQLAHTAHCNLAVMLVNDARLNAWPQLATGAPLTGIIV